MLVGDEVYRVHAWPFMHHLEVSVSIHRQLPDNELAPVQGFSFTMDEPPADLSPAKRLQEILVVVIEHL